MNNRNIVLAILILLIIATLAYYGRNTFFSGKNTSSATNQLQVPSPIATENLNKEFSFPIKDSQDKEIGTIKYIIQSVEKRTEIYVKGQPAKALAGKYFLIFNIKFINQLDQGIKINARDYLRLSVNNSKDWLAPNIHNDPVEVQAISTENTRLGFVINTTDKNFTLQVGEIKGKKQTIKIKPF